MVTVLRPGPALLRRMSLSWRRNAFFVWLVIQSVAESRTLNPSTKPSSVLSSGPWANCPVACFCSSLSRIVYCSRRGLGSIPEGVAADSLQLNMNGNHFASPLLHRSNFSGLARLEHLYLSECGVEGIEVGTFLELQNLKWLDLSNNRLRTLSPSSFQGLNLQHLFLNGNRQLELTRDSFAGLVTVGLYLHDCSLGWIHPEVLSPLSSSLKYLWLNGNELSTLDPQLEPIFLSLTHLRLSSNPIHCNCRLSWLKALFDSNGDTFKGAVPPSCLGPSRLKGRYFNDVTAAEFRCQAPMFSNIDATFGQLEGQLRCRASGDPSPDIFWIQPSGRTTRYQVPEGPDARANQATLAVNRTDTDPHLFGMYICVATNEAGNVTLTINVSWPLTPMEETPSSSTSILSSSSANPHAPVQLLQGRGSQSTTPSEQDHLWGGRTITSSQDDDDTGHGVLLTTRPNYTLIQPLDRKRPGDEARMFSVVQMVCAVVGSHVCTLVLCLVAVPLCYRSRWTRLKPRPMPIGERQVVCKKLHAPEVTIPDSPSIDNTGCSQFYLPDYFITSPQ